MAEQKAKRKSKKSVNVGEDFFGPSPVKMMFKSMYRKAFDAGYDLSSSRRVIIDSAADYEREYDKWFEKHWDKKGMGQI